MRKIRAMFSKATLHGDLTGDVHDYCAQLVGMQALKSLRNLTSEDASKVIKDLEAREEAFAERERIKKALGTPEE